MMPLLLLVLLVAGHGTAHAQDRRVSRVPAPIAADGGSQELPNPSGVELRRAVEDFIGRYGYVEGHRILIFFSGHGYTLDKGARGYFVPRDAPDPITNESGFRRTADQVSGRRVVRSVWFTVLAS